MSINEEKLRNVIDYYDHTRYDYRVAWDNSATPAVHFGFYDENYHKHSEALMNTNRVMAEWVNVQPGEKILDAGCGKGGSCFWLSLNMGVETIGITPVQSQINDCIAQSKKLNLGDKTSFVLADYCDTDFPDQSFDVVWACESLCHAEEKALFYLEAYRLLKPGGRLIIAEYVRSKRPAKEKDEKLLKSWLDRWAISDLDTTEEHRQNAQNAGFRDVEITDVTKNMKVSLRNLSNNSRNWLWFSKLLQIFGSRSAIQHANMYASIKLYQALKKEIWYYAFISAKKA